MTFITRPTVVNGPAAACVAVLDDGRMMLSGTHQDSIYAIFDPVIGYVNTTPLANSGDAPNQRCVANRTRFLLSHGKYPTTVDWYLKDREGTTLSSLTFTASPDIRPLGLTHDSLVAFYGEGDTIKRRVLASNSVTSFATRTGHTTNSGFCLPNGDLVVAWTDSIVRYTSTGLTAMVYPTIPTGVGYPPTVAHDPDWLSIWAYSALTNTMFQYNTATGIIVQRLVVNPLSPDSFAVFPKNVPPLPAEWLPDPPATPTLAVNPPAPFLVDRADVVGQILTDLKATGEIDKDISSGQGCVAFTVARTVATALATEGAGLVLWVPESIRNMPSVIYEPYYSCVYWTAQGGNGFQYWSDLVMYPNGTAYYILAGTVGGLVFDAPVWTYAGMLPPSLWSPPVP